MRHFSDIASTPVLRPTEPDAGPAVLHAEITEGWTQGKAAFGGLQGALGLIAMRAAVGDALPLRALQMTFVASVDPGPARAEATRVRAGRAVTHAQCTLYSGDRVAGLLVGLFGSSRASQACLDMPMPADVKPYRDAQDVPFMPERMPGFLRFYRQRWVGGARPYSSTAPKPARMWAQLREASPDEGEASALLAAPGVREANVVALADLPPAPVLSMLDSRKPGASLTWLLEFFVDVRDVDPADWLLLETETRHAADGYTSQTARIWDERGRAIGVSHQTTAIFG
jgi:acyl-CoA thioesterase